MKALFSIAILLVCQQASALSRQCASDVTGDGVVNAEDLVRLLSDWGECPDSPSIESVSPAEGGQLGGTQLTIVGHNLGGASAVLVGGAACTGLQVVGSTMLRAVTPPGLAGSVAVSVVTPSGTASLPNAFTYRAASISSVSPGSGSYTGGTLITITGSYLNGVTTVRVGGAVALNVNVVNATTVTAFTPAGSLGTFDVQVAGPGGVSVLPGAFTYTGMLPWATVLEQLPDPFFVPDANARAAIVATGLPWRVRHVASQIEMLLVPPGNFGGIYTPQPFYLGRYEVKQSEWTGVIGSNPSFFVNPSRPVDSVYVGLSAQFLAATGLRLPSAAEWEYACRAGTTTNYHGSINFPNGTNDPVQAGAIAWTGANSGGQTSVVGQRLPNGWGFFDMSGNVGEWVSDNGGPGVGNRWKGGSYQRGPEQATSGWSYCEQCLGMAFERMGFRAAKSP